MEQLKLYNKAKAVEQEEDKVDNLQRQAKFHIMGPLGKLYNIIIYIYGLAGHIKEFKDLAGRLILLNNHIRWNSWYYMLYMALQHKSAFDTYIKKYFDTL